MAARERREVGFRSGRRSRERCGRAGGESTNHRRRGRTDAPVHGSAWVAAPGNATATGADAASRDDGAAIPSPGSPAATSTISDATDRQAEGTARKHRPASPPGAEEDCGGPGVDHADGANCQSGFDERDGSADGNVGHPVARLRRTGPRSRTGRGSSLHCVRHVSKQLCRAWRRYAPVFAKQSARPGTVTQSPHLKRNFRPSKSLAIVAAPLYLRCSLKPAWRNWQTRWTQNPLSARACGFDPLRRYPFSPGEEWQAEA